MHARFGTAKWFTAESKHDFLDFISARSETYSHPGALPTVKRGTMADDLRRRDFTINTLALRLDGVHFGELRDDLGGLNDLNQGLVRALHPASYRDDPTRILRAVRYEQRYGFQIAEPDLEYIDAARPLLERISADRLRHELNQILLEKKAARILDRLAELRVLKSIHPALPWNKNLSRALETGLEAVPPAGWGHLPDLVRTPRRVALGTLLWLMRLSSTDIEAVDSRLHFTSTLKTALLAAAALRRDMSALSGKRPSAVCDRLEGMPPLAVFSVYITAGRDKRKILDSYMISWRHIAPRTTGDDLIRRGLRPGPVFQIILRRLREAWLDGELKTAAGEEELIGKLVREYSRQTEERR